MTARRLVTVVLGLLLILYPLLVYFGLQEFGPRALACVLLLAALTKLAATKLTRQPVGNGLWLLIAAAVAGGITLLTGSVIGLKFYPVIVNLVLLAVFSLSLYRPPSMIERFARLQTPDLPMHAIGYTRRVTWVWCGFFAINGVLACLSVFASDKLWALYNGLLSYVFIGVLLAGEYLVRLRVQRKHAAQEQHLKHKLAEND